MLDFLRDIAAFRSCLLDAFLKPLLDAFPSQLPVEIVLKIWLLAQPQFTLQVAFMNLVETRKFLLLLKTTVLAIYNQVLRGKPFFLSLVSLTDCACVVLAHCKADISLMNFFLCNASEIFSHGTADET